MLFFQKKRTNRLPLARSADISDSPIKHRLWVWRLLLCLTGVFAWKTIKLVGGRFSTCHGWKSQHSNGPVQWSKCDDIIECGSLEVPLDHHNLSAGKVRLALARYPATNKADRIGSLFVNPGGPGGSGVRFIYRYGRTFSELFDGRYDILGWDPRGVNGSLPRVECFASQTEEDIFYAHTAYEAGISRGNLSNPSDLARFTAQLELDNARNEALVQICIKRSGEDILKHVGTATVARDLELLSRTLEGDAPVNYWGFSYGTTIAQYFMNIFPDRVGRVTIDGVGDPVSWSTEHEVQWGKHMYLSSEHVLDGFINACSSAGPDRCSLATNVTTPSEIRRKIDKLLVDTYERPIPVPNARRPGALTQGQLTNLIFMRMYAPRTWSSLADLLSAAIAGDGAPILDAVQSDIQLNERIPAETVLAGNAVICVDGPPYNDNERENLTKNTIEEVRAGLKISPHFGTFGLPDRCHLWPVREAEYFTGPWNSTLSNDVLIIGNTYDPIAPYSEAKAVHAVIKQSKLVQHDGYGHCSVAMASLCTARILREYYLNGTLPSADESFCPVVEPLFPSSGSETDISLWSGREGEADLTAEDRRLLKILVGFGSNVEPMALHRVGRYLGL